jgi:hypothetical protein
MGFAALLLMNGKYEDWQGHIENVYRYGTRTLHRPAGATLSDPSGKSNNDAADGDDSSNRAPLAADLPPPKMLVSLAPLRVLLGVAMVVSCVALQWSYLRRRANAKQ